LTAPLFCWSCFAGLARRGPIRFRTLLSGEPADLLQPFPGHRQILESIVGSRRLRRSDGRDHTACSAAEFERGSLTTCKATKRFVVRAASGSRQIHKRLFRQVAGGPIAPLSDRSADGIFVFTRCIG
jgi:hypothetical protein